MRFKNVKLDRAKKREGRSCGKKTAVAICWQFKAKGNLIAKTLQYLHSSYAHFTALEENLK